MAASAPARPAGALSALPPGRLTRILGDPRRVLLVSATLAAFAACVDVLDDPDLWWHLRLGRWILDNRVVPHQELFSFTAAGHPMVAHEWGSEVLFSLVSRVGGLLAVALLMAAVGWSALVALALRSRARGAGPVVTAVAVLVGARAAEPVLGTRPQVITVALVCWTLLLAERHLARGGRAVWLLAPLGLVWANLHGAFVIGVGALALAAALEAMRRRLGRPGAAPWRRIAQLAGATAAMGALGCLNPNGPGLYRYVIQTSSSERLKPIAEWHAPDFHDPANIGLLVLLASFALLLALGGRPSLRDLGMAAVGLGAALLAVRNTSLAVALALPGWAVMLQQVVDRVAARRAARRAVRRTHPARAPALLAGGIVVAMALLVDGVVAARAAGDASDRGVARVYPACAASALASAPGVRVFAPYFHSGYLVERLWPGGRVYLYGESVSLGTRSFDDYERILGGGPQALRLLAGSGSNAVLTGAGALQDTLDGSSRWQKVLDDPSGLTLFAAPGLAARLTLPHC
jgi:hypothetical protein